jgi:hypothetical protein
MAAATEAAAAATSGCGWRWEQRFGQDRLLVALGAAQIGAIH